MIGLSGLITPSLEEMVHVAREMERQGFEVPLLIGGATTSRTHTAVKIAPAYHGPVVHVLDASRAVGVVGQLKGQEKRAELDAQNRAEQERLRREHEARQREQPLVSLEQARKRRTALDWAGYTPPQPEFRGARQICDVDLTRSCRSSTGRPSSRSGSCAARTRASSRTRTGERRRARCSSDAQAMLKQLVEGGKLKARASYGFFPAAAVGDDVEIYADDSRSGLLGTLHTLRQQAVRADGLPAQALADFVAPRDSRARGLDRGRSP